MQIEIDSAKCQSHKRCMAVAPAVFGLGGDGKAELLDPHGADDAVVLKAAKSCPYRAIIVRDETTSEQLWPRVP
ncbi:MAG: ferredoxin [Candidatus Lustribacter sp.]|jgi:ferredoxin